MRIHAIVFLGLGLSLGACQSVGPAAMRTDMHPDAGRDMIPGATWRTASSDAGAQWRVGRDASTVVMVSSTEREGLRQVRQSELANLVGPPPMSGSGCRVEIAPGSSRPAADGCAPASPLAGVTGYRREGSQIVFLRGNGRPVRVTFVD